MVLLIWKQKNNRPIVKWNVDATTWNITMTLDHVLFQYERVLKWIPPSTESNPGTSGPGHVTLQYRALIQKTNFYQNWQTYNSSNLLKFRRWQNESEHSICDNAHVRLVGNLHESFPWLMCITVTFSRFISLVTPPRTNAIKQSTSRLNFWWITRYGATWARDFGSSVRCRWAPPRCCRGVVRG